MQIVLTIIHERTKLFLHQPRLGHEKKENYQSHNYLQN